MAFPPRQLCFLLWDIGQDLDPFAELRRWLDPSRFRRSRDVAAYFGLTSKRRQSGSSIDFQKRISKVGDPDVRFSLYEAASGLLTRFKGKDKIKRWRTQLGERRCHRKAAVAVARKLAVLMHACGSMAPSIWAMRRQQKWTSPHA